MNKTKLVGIAWQALAYAVAVGVAVVTYNLIADQFSLLIRFLIADAVATIAIFLFSRVSGNSSFYDPYWSVQPVVIAAFLFMMGGFEWNLFDRSTLVLLLVVLYGGRLTYNFLRGWDGLVHQDWRYDDLKKKNPRSYWWVSLSGIHMFPTLLVFGGCLSLFIVFRDDQAALSYLDVIAIVVTLGGIFLEAIADEQLHHFRKSNPRGTLLNTGLWSVIRYPNYLGEITFWWGLFIFALAADISSWWVIIGPLAIHALFVFISIPMKDERMLESRKDYRKHMEQVPALIPNFRRK
jgi:steroid 5-alpha reductase family enzyme